MPLTDTAIRNAKARITDYKMGDSGGLYLQVTKAGGTLWRFKFRADGKERELALGRYPDIGLPRQPQPIRGWTKSGRPP